MTQEQKEDLDKKIEAIAATAPDYLILLDFDKNLSQLSAKDFGD